jgi:hypothetical protein
MFGYTTPNRVSSRLLPARVRVLTRMWTTSPRLIHAPVSMSDNLEHAPGHGVCREDEGSKSRYFHTAVA